MKELGKESWRNFHIEAVKTFPLKTPMFNNKPATKSHVGPGAYKAKPVKQFAQRGATAHLESVDRGGATPIT